MKTILIISTVLLSLQSVAQLAGHLELNKSTVRGSEGIEIGAGMQYPISLDFRDKLILAPNVAFRYLLGGSNELTSYSIPLLAVGRYYVYGKQGCSGGAYLEANAGANFQNQFVEVLGIKYKDSRVSPEFSAGLGYRGGMGYDFGVRLAWNRFNQTTTSFFGLRFGYTF
jgi:hypothetical protein